MNSWWKWVAMHSAVLSTTQLQRTAKTAFFKFPVGICSWFIFYDRKEKYVQ